MLPASRCQDRHCSSAFRIISALSIISPFVLLQCSATRNRGELVRALEDEHLGIATLDVNLAVAGDVYRVLRVSFTGAQSWGPALEGVQVPQVRTSPHGDRF